MIPDRAETGVVDIFWLPQGAGGHSVRLDGRPDRGRDVSRRDLTVYAG
jgi:hypothetical protein